MRLKDNVLSISNGFSNFNQWKKVEKEFEGIKINDGMKKIFLNSILHNFE